jgi:two-component system chemotaxis sensor kinase CheA
MMEIDDPKGKAVRDFLAESEEILDQVMRDILALGDSADRGDTDPETVNSIFRGAHSLKGLAGMFGYGDIADLSHTMESLLDCLRLGKVSLDSATLGILSEAVEMLGLLIRSLESGAGAPPGLARVLEKITGRISSARREPVAVSPEELGISDRIIHSLTEYEDHRLRENIARGKSLYLFHAVYPLDTFDRELGDVLDFLKGIGEVISTLPSAEGGMENSIGFDILVGTARGKDELDCLQGLDGVSVTALGHAASGSGRPAPRTEPAGEFTESTGAGSGAGEPPAGGSAVSPSARSLSRTMRVDVAKLDELMNIVGELIISHGTVAAISNRMQGQGFSGLSIELTKAARGMERKLTELQQRVMDVRMIPVGQLFERMSRIVRKICREQGKKIELRMSGADTELDKMIMEDIADPLMHIIRNAIDHGIEPPEERVAHGKAEQGTIRLSSFQKGNHVVIEVDDDGRGFDHDRILAKALEMGLVDSAEGMTPKEALSLIFLPGFSTADQVSDVSGRGVGMDVVKNNIAAVSGTVEIKSSPGEGSRVIITLPITLAIIKALIVQSSSRSFAIPVTSVRETLSLEGVEIRTVERKRVIQLRESTMPLLTLEKFFGLDSCPELPESPFAVVVGESDKRIGIVVDDLLGQQDLVIKSLGSMFKGVGGIAGAADLGDQSTILVLDVSGIVAETMRGTA